MQFRTSSQVGSALGGPRLISRYVAALRVGGLNQRNQTGPSSGRIWTRSRLFGYHRLSMFSSSKEQSSLATALLKDFQAGQRADDCVDKANRLRRGRVSNSSLQGASNARASRSGWVRVRSEDTSARCEHVSRTLLPVQLGDRDLA